MFNDIETSNTMKRLFEERLTESKSSEEVLAAFNAKHDFGKDFFHKILNKGILKPSTPEAKESAAG